MADKDDFNKALGKAVGSGNGTDSGKTFFQTVGEGLGMVKPESDPNMDAMKRRQKAQMPSQDN